ncbi:MAG: LAGLIDADG family homing endonuclease [Nitrososphaerota archaeon]
MSTGDMVEGPASGVGEGSAPGPEQPNAAGGGGWSGCPPSLDKAWASGEGRGSKTSETIPQKFPKHTTTVRRGPYMPRELRIKLYEDVRRLREEGFSYSRIIDIIRQERGITLRKSHISEWVRQIHNPYNGIRIPSVEVLRPSKELAYVIGVVAGDGYVWRKKRPQKSYQRASIGLMVKDREFAEEFSRCLGVILGREPPKPKWSGRLFVIAVQSKTLYQLLMKPINLEKVRKFVGHDEECKSAFLRGFFDSEGSVRKDGVITVSNTDLALLNYIWSLLSSMGVNTTEPRLQTKSGTPIKEPRSGKIHYTKKDVYILHIPAAFRLTFYKHIGFTIERKQRRLQQCLVRLGLLKSPLLSLHTLFSLRFIL